MEIILPVLTGIVGFIVAFLLNRGAVKRTQREGEEIIKELKERRDFINKLTAAIDESTEKIEQLQEVNKLKEGRIVDLQNDLKNCNTEKEKVLKENQTLSIQVENFRALEYKINKLTEEAKTEKENLRAFFISNTIETTPEGIVKALSNATPVHLDRLDIARHVLEYHQISGGLFKLEKLK